MLQNQSSAFFIKQRLWAVSIWDFVAWAPSLEAVSGAMPYKMAAHLFLSAVAGCSGAEHPAVHTTDEATPARWLPLSGCTSHGTWCPRICHGTVIDVLILCKQGQISDFPSPYKKILKKKYLTPLEESCGESWEGKPDE